MQSFVLIMLGLQGCCLFGSTIKWVWTNPAQCGRGSGLSGQWAPEEVGFTGPQAHSSSWYDAKLPKLNHWEMIGEEIVEIWDIRVTNVALRVGLYIHQT